MKKTILLSSIAIVTILGISACDSTNKYNRHGVETTIGGNPGGTPTNGVVTDNPAPFKPIDNPVGTITPPDTNGTTTSDSNNSATIKTILGTYSVKITPEYDSITAGQTQNIHYEITNFFTKKPADDSVVNYIKFEIDKKHAEFFDPQGRHGDTIEFKNAKATGDIAIKSTNLSGQVPINFNAVIDNTDINLTQSLPVVIEKNKSSSMAIVPIGTTYADGLFTEKFVIHVVDSYGNKAQDGTRISTGVINNPKLYSRAYDGGKSEINGLPEAVDDQTLPRNRYQSVSKIDYNPNTYQRTVSYTLKNDKGTLHKEDGTFTLNTSGLSTTKDKISNLDTLIVLANESEHKPYNLGGWDIKSVDSDSKLTLYDLDLGSAVSDVNYVIGDEYRYDRCNETIMNAAASTFTSTEVKDGVAYAELRYVPAMVGKNVFIYANSNLDGNRIGISRKLLLAGTGLEESTFTCKNESEDENSTTSCTERFQMIQSDSGKIARDVYIAQPVASGIANYTAATASRTDCNGWTTVTIYGVPGKKSSSVKIGGKILSDELIVNKKK